MAIQSPQEWLASKSSGNTVKKTSRIQSPLEWLKSKPKSKVELEKEERLAQGLPISTTTKRAAPTGLGNIIRDVVKPVADVAANAINAGRIVAGKETKDTFKSSYLGDVKGLGQVDITKSPFDKDNLKVILKSAATGAEIASYLSAGGVAKGTLGDLTKRGILASKKTFAEWVVKKFPELAKEGFIQGTAYTVGSQGRDYVETGKKFSVGQAVKDIGLSTIGNVAIPAIIQKGFGTSAAKIAGARAGEKAAQEAEILGKKIPNAVTPETRPVVKTTEAFDVADKLGYNFQTSTDILRDVVEKTGRSGTYNVDDIIEAAKKYPPEKPPTVEIPDSIVDDAVEPTAKAEPVAIPKETPEVKTKVQSEKKTISDIEDIMRVNTSNVDDTFIRQKSTEYFNKLQKYTPDEILNKLDNGETIESMPREALSSFLARYADDTGDLALAKRVTKQTFAEKGGQEAQARILSKGSTADLIRDIQKGRAKTQGIDLQKAEKNVKRLTKDLVGKVKEVVESTSSVKATKEQIIEIINKLVC